MSSLDFEVEKTNFLDFYNSSHQVLEGAKDSFIALIKSLLINDGPIVFQK